MKSTLILSLLLLVKLGANTQELDILSEKLPAEYNINKFYLEIKLKGIDAFVEAGLDDQLSVYYSGTENSKIENTITESVVLLNYVITKYPKFKYILKENFNKGGIRLQGRFPELIRYLNTYDKWPKVSPKNAKDPFYNSIIYTVPYEALKKSKILEPLFDWMKISLCEKPYIHSTYYTEIKKLLPMQTGKKIITDHKDKKLYFPRIDHIIIDCSQ